MIEIKVLIILAKELESIKDELIEPHSFEFTNLEDEQLEEKILDSDIQMVVIDRHLKNFTKELYEKIDKEYFSVYFNPIKVKVNKLSPIEFKSIREVQSFKESVDNPRVFELEVLQEDLKSKIEEVRAKKEAELRPQIDSTYLEAIKIENYFSIKEMEIDDLKGKKEIYFVGENGDGKTVLLQAIALALKGDDYEILAEDYIKNIKGEMKFSTKESKFPTEYRTYKNVKNLFAYGINRNKISNNEEDTKVTSYSGLFDTPSIYKTTLLRDAESFLLQENDLVNEFKEKIAFLMDEKFQIVKTEKGLKYGDIEQFSMLSEGYKTTLIWLSDLLSRMMENDKNNEIEKLKDFKAIVLIDEVDLYLHPKWKYDFMNKLTSIFPNIQFIMTTHSLVTILGADEKAVFYKVYKEEGETKITNQILNNRGYTNNTLISSPIFALDTMTSRHYEQRKLSEDDYVYELIHDVVSKKIKKNLELVDEEMILKLIEAEFEKHEKN